VRKYCLAESKYYSVSIAANDGAWCSQHSVSVVASCNAVRMTSCMLTSCHKCALQVAAETDDRSQKTSKRRLWSDDLDLSPEQQAKDVDAYLAIDPWADEVKPADYQVRASSLRTAWKPPGYSSRLNSLEAGTLGPACDVMRTLRHRVCKGTVLVVRLHEDATFAGSGSDKLTADRPCAGGPVYDAEAVPPTSTLRSSITPSRPARHVGRLCTSHPVVNTGH